MCLKPVRLRGKLSLADQELFPHYSNSVWLHLPEWCHAYTTLTPSGPRAVGEEPLSFFLPHAPLGAGNRLFGTSDGSSDKRVVGVALSQHIYRHRCVT